MLLKKITSFYLESPEFNGVPIYELVRQFPKHKLKKNLVELIRDDLVTIVFGDRHSNPHIRALPNHLSTDEQIRMLDETQWTSACVYPNSNHLTSIIEPGHYEGRPYTFAIACGLPVLLHASFHIEILENYRNDPRFIYETNDLGGRLSVTDSYFEADQLLERRSAFLQTFGFSFDEQMNRYVAVFLRYLSKLSAEQQQVWKTYEVSVPAELHPDYYRRSIVGDFGLGISMFRAFVLELQAINQLATLISGQRLFRKDFAQDRPPREFAFLLRPTEKEFESFVHLLDKLLSDNLERKFFRGLIPLEEEVTRGDGKILVTPLGTLQLLQKWAEREFASRANEIAETLAILRSIRKLRQQPAHGISENRFDQKFLHQQRQLINDALFSVSQLRRVMQDHPSAIDVKFNHDPDKFKIWSY